MKRRNKSYKRKLNMLTPGLWFCGIFIILLIICSVFYYTGLDFASKILGIILIISLAAFIILLVIEQKQDKKQYEEAKSLDKEIK